MFGACDRGGVLESYNVQHGTCTVQSDSIAVAVGMHCWNICGEGMDVHLHAGGTAHGALLSHASTPHVYVYNYCLGLTAAVAV